MPVLETLGIEHALMEGPGDISAIERMVKVAHEAMKPAAVVVGAETL
jgi:hypothetical protein